MKTVCRCFDCFRPASMCYCAAIPKIENRTEVLILQHRRERFHRFNTARIVHKGLRNCQLLADRTDALAERLQLKPGAGLLYPGPEAILIDDLPATQRPQQLVVVDGTWHHTKTLVRDITALQQLPHYQLSPATPSRYRIRQEPDDTCLSTVEAIVAALRLLEPETIGLEKLLVAFERMVDLQLAHPGSEQGARFIARGSRTVKNIPTALQGDLSNIVVAYGEGMPGERGAGKRAAGPPICWVAHRLRDGREFSCTLIPGRPLNDVFLGHLQLTRDDFAAALTLDEVKRRWAEFEQPGDIVAVFQPGTAQLYSHLVDRPARCLVLKSVDLKALLSELAPFGASSAATPSLARQFGRASQRLNSLVALVRQLNALVNSHRRRNSREVVPIV